MRFEFAKPVSDDESRELEFKTVSSKNPVRAIADTCERYAVAFLNGRGGKILWGIRDGDKIVEGVSLSPKQRDEVRQTVVAKLNSIEPKIDPTRFVLELHPVKKAPPGTDLVIVSLTIPRVRNKEPFYGSGRDAFVRLDGVVRHLTGPELTAWITQRASKSRKPADEESVRVEIYHGGEKLPFERDILFDLRSGRSIDRAKVTLDFHLPADAGSRKKQTFGVVTSSFITEVPDWSRERVGPITLPDGRHLFTSDLMTLNLAPGGWHRYEFTLHFREHVVMRTEEFAIRLFSESGPADTPFALLMLGNDPGPRRSTGPFLE